MRAPYAVWAFGDVALHVTTGYPTPPRGQDTIDVGPVELTLGGGAALVCQQVASLGRRARLDATLGTDVLAGWIRIALEERNVDYPTPTQAGTRSGRSVILLDGPRSHHINYEPPDGDPGALVQRVRDVNAENATMLYVSGFPGYEPVLEEAARVSSCVVTDLGFRPWMRDPASYRRNVLERAGHATICQLSGDGLSDDEQSDLLDAVVAEGAELAVVTLGRRGAVFKERGGPPRHVSAPTVEPVNTVGAGDAFTAGLIFALDNGTNAMQATSYGCATAAAAVRLFPEVPTKAAVDSLLLAE